MGSEQVLKESKNLNKQRGGGNPSRENGKKMGINMAWIEQRFIYLHTYSLRIYLTFTTCQALLGALYTH